jgi:hypothetical protein
LNHTQKAALGKSILDALPHSEKLLGAFDTTGETTHELSVSDKIYELKKIRDDDGYWHQVEAYIEDHSNAEFTHGVCPDCLSVLYPHYTPTTK